MKTARQTAFDILIKITRDNAYSNLTLDSQIEKSDLDSRDKALTSAIVYGVLERKLTLNYNLEKHLTQPLKKLKPEVLVILQIGAYQLLFMDKIPVSAAINESVKLTKGNKCSFASGLVNAVLRAVAKTGLILPEIDDNRTEYYSIKYSCPTRLVKLWISSYGEENTKGILEASIGTPPIVIRVNTLKTTAAELINILSEYGVEAQTVDEVPNALVLNNSGGIENLPSYKKGLFHVQDTASQLCCMALNAKPGETVFDLCAAPGGKSFTTAQYMNNEGTLRSFDLYPARVGLINSGAERLGISIIKADTSDAFIFNEEIGQADKVLCDVPCSGLGIIRRKPEIKYKELENLDNLTDMQYHILRTATQYTKIGGMLIYSTCTLNPKENEELCDRFLNENKNFKVVKPLSIKTYNEGSNYLTLMPHINNSDGFFIAAFIRME